MRACVRETECAREEERIQTVRERESPSHENKPVRSHYPRTVQPNMRDKLRPKKEGNRSAGREREAGEKETGNRER